MTNLDIARQYVEHGFEPFPVGTDTKKVIPAGVTGRSANWSTDLAKTLFTDPRAGSNLGLHANGWIAIDVDHYDDKTGASTLDALQFELGDLPATITSTARPTPSGQRFFRVPADMEFVSSLGTGIDIIQASHRFSLVHPSFHPKTGTQYQWYAADGSPLDGLPHVSDFAELPEAWIEHMRRDAPPTHDGFNGDINDWLETLTPGAPSFKVEAFLRRIPTENFDHTDVTRVTFELVRLGAEGEPGVHEAFDTLWDTWVRAPYDTPEVVREFTTAVQGAIRKAGAKRDSTVEDALNKIDNPRFEYLVFESTNADELPELLAFVAKLDTDSAAEILATSHIGKNADAPLAENDSGEQVSDRLELLTPAEREVCQNTPNFIDLYCHVATLRDHRPNMPYYRLDALQVLSVTLGRFGYLPAREGSIPLNIWSMKVGDTTSGKGVSKHQMRETLRLASVDDFADVDYGSKTSKEALQRWLIEHDGRTTFFNTDEGHGWLKSLRSRGGYEVGLQEDFTNYYDGHVPAYHFKNDTEFSGKTAKTTFCVWIQGTPKGMIQNMYPDQAESGFLVRFLTAFGEPRKVERRVDEEQDEHADETGADPFIAAMAQGLYQRAKEISVKPNRPIRAPQEVRERLADAMDALVKFYEGHRLADIIVPGLIRQKVNIWKVAALLAMSESRLTIRLSDMLLAIREWEAYAVNAVSLMEQISANEFERELNEVLKWISGRKRPTDAMVRRQFSGKQNIGPLLERLEQNGQIKREQIPGDKERGMVWVAA